MSDETQTSRRLTLTPASKIRMRRVGWVWEERIPCGALTLVPGREGIGKSLLLAWLSAQVTRGTLPGCFLGEPRAVIYAASEDSWEHTIAPRLYAAGADLDLVYRVDVEMDGTIGQLTLPSDTSALTREAKKIGVGLVAADPLLSLIQAGIDTHRDRELRTALEPLARLADDAKCAVVGLAHFNKSASTDALNLITGSRAFSAVARAVLAVARDTEADDGSCVLSQAKNNLGRLDLPSLRYVVASAEVPTDEGPACVGRLEFTGETDRSVSDILSDRGDSEGVTERSEAERWLINYLIDASGSAEAADILREGTKLGISKTTLHRARKAAGIQSGKTGFGGGWRWYLDATPAEDSAKGPKIPRSGELKPSEPSVQPSRRTWLTSESGPCTRCQTMTHRYGSGGGPLCPACLTSIRTEGTAA